MGIGVLNGPLFSTTMQFINDSELGLNVGISAPSRTATFRTSSHVYLSDLISGNADTHDDKANAIPLKALVLPLALSPTKSTSGLSKENFLSSNPRKL